VDFRIKYALRTAAPLAHVSAKRHLVKVEFAVECDYVTNIRSTIYASVTYTVYLSHRFQKKSCESQFGIKEFPIMLKF